MADGGEIACIVNPDAGRGSGKRAWERIESKLVAKGRPYTVSFSHARGEARKLTRDALRRGASTLVSVGGDGTAHEVVNGYFESGSPINADARVTFISAGTGNDISREFPGQEGALFSDDADRIDLLRIRYPPPDATERYALLHLGVGLVTEVVEMSIRMKHRLGPLVYAGSSALALFRHHPSRIRYTADGGSPVEQAMNMIVVANGRYAGGGMLIAPSASMRDEHLDVVTAQGASKSELLFQLLPALYRGEHLNHPAVGYTQARMILIESDTPLPVQIDGELEGKTPISIDVLPGILPVSVSTPRNQPTD